MIANFRYEKFPTLEAVSVKLFWSGDDRMGNVVVSEQLAQEIADNDMPSAEGAMKIAMALAYAVVLAANSGTRLVISGDQSVWPMDWGALILAH